MATKSEEYEKGREAGYEEADGGHFLGLFNGFAASFTSNDYQKGYSDGRDERWGEE